ncbi:extracellular catalytic domain type 1 short-chain-length polyhydroxyalkanoate depolymerase [Catellatospora tritici]|uniref:extracellular catalytic domain type 1 short-chain-length polyhydroxyalkanoate depolymerase n=1 Tax=Catellatospora tritici TaxID=2851566 RepID=UPI001C2D373C|nr:PHB depolymerase family esterase [Catellatospora tritici]MBV1853079.1 PHB depolymerase family esterase [Catellatospora tritici]
MKLRRAMHALWLAVVPVVAAAILSVATPAQAATLTEVTNFGTNPGNLRMYLYVPNNVATRPGLLVANHYCTGNGPAFYSGTQFAQLADQYGFIVIYPSVTASDACFDVASTATLTHNGGGDSLSIVSMVKYVQQNYNSDPNRTYATGVSSGAMMTNVLLGAYPDVFKAGSAFAGVPFGCFAGPTKWNSQCAQGQLTKTAAQWGDLVRNAYPGYTGSRPRMQLWHGTNDETLNYVNFGEAIKQWTNVNGLSQTPTSTDTPASGQTRTRYANSSGQVLVEAYSLANTSHNLPVNAASAVAFFGLNTTSSPSPSVSPSRSASPSPSASASSSPSPSPSGNPNPGGCTAVFSATSVWQTGFVGNVHVTAGTGGIRGWRVTLTLPSGASVVNSWNGVFAGTSGTIQVTNMPYNGQLGAGAATDFGFQANGTSPTATVSCTAL